MTDYWFAETASNLSRPPYFRVTPRAVSVEGWFFGPAVTLAMLVGILAFAGLWNTLPDWVDASLVVVWIAIWSAIYAAVAKRKTDPEYDYFEYYPLGRGRLWWSPPGPVVRPTTHIREDLGGQK